MAWPMAIKTSKLLSFSYGLRTSIASWNLRMVRRALDCTTAAARAAARASGGGGAVWANVAGAATAVTTRAATVPTLERLVRVFNASVPFLPETGAGGTV